MVFILSLAVAAALTALIRNPLKKHPVPFYVFATVICACLALLGPTQFPVWVEEYVLDLFRRGTLGTAFFVIVMYIAVLKNGSTLMKKLMPVRGELSILATILCLCHNFFFGRTYFVAMFTDAGRLPLNQLAAGVLSILMICIMVPLFVMSFPKVRRKMNAKRWKQIQRLAYGYYGMLYIHVAVLILPLAMRGMIKYAISLTAYSLVFGAYGVLRLRKAKFAKHIRLSAQLLCIVLPAAVTAAAWFGVAQSITPEAPPTEGGLRDGTYSAAGTGYNGPVEVIVVIEDGQIAQLTLGENSEDGAYLDQAVALFDDVLEQQTYAVDSVSGATVSSVAIKSAIKKALAAAAGEAKPASSGETEDSITYEDGTYTGTGAGYGGKIVVEVDIVNGEIHEIRLTDHREDRAYLEQAMQVVDDIIASQSYEVDAVTGATLSSDGIITAVRRALRQAKAD